MRLKIWVFISILLLLISSTNAKERLAIGETEFMTESKLAENLSANTRDRAGDMILPSVKPRPTLVLDQNIITLFINDSDKSRLNRTITPVEGRQKKDPIDTKKPAVGLIKFANIDTYMIVDGTFIVGFKSYRDPYIFADKHGVEVISAFPVIGSASFRNEDLTTLYDVMDDIGNDTNVNSVTLDYIDPRIGPE